MIFLLDKRGRYQNEKSKRNSNEGEYSSLDSDSIIDFEKKRNILSHVRLDFNKAEICTEKKYVTQGKACLHLCPEMEEISEGSYYVDATLYIFPNKTSYLDTEYVSIDVYNAKEHSIKAIFGGSSVNEEFEVKPGKNTLWLYIDRALLNYSAVGQIKSFFIKFEGECKEQGSLDVYIDNMRCYYAKTDYEKYNNDFSQNVWYSFETDSDKANFWSHGTVLSEFSKPVTKINRDIRYIKSGTGSLRVDFRNTKEGAMDTRMIRTADNMTGDLNQYLSKLEQYYLGFPIYNANDFDISCAVTVISNSNESMGVSTIIKAGCWSSDDFCIPLDELKATFTGSGFDIMTIIFEFGAMSEEGTIYLDSLGVYSVE